MKGFCYAAALQFRLDIRSKALLITCYLVPLLFFGLMRRIFTSLDPNAKTTLLPSMTVMGVSMGALIGLPPTLTELYGTQVKKMYQAGGVPLCMGAITTALSAFVHLMILGGILYLAAPLAFDAALPKHPIPYFASLALLIAVTLSLGCVLGLAVKNQSKLTMICQLFFLPSILLSGILVPVELLPLPLSQLGMLFPAYWGYRLMQEDGFGWENLWPLLILLLVAVSVCGVLLRRIRRR